MCPALDVLGYCMQAVEVETGRFGWSHNCNQARSRSRQRHQRERTGFGVKFGGDVAMWSGVTEIERERGLRIAPAVHLDAGGGSAGRIATIGADDQPRDN